MENVFPISVRYKLLSNRIYDSGGIGRMAGLEGREFAGLWRLSEKARSEVKAGLEAAGLRVIGTPRYQGDLVVVYHPQTYAGHILDRQLGREPLPVTELYTKRLHPRTDALAN